MSETGIRNCLVKEALTIINFQKYDCLYKLLGIDLYSHTSKLQKSGCIWNASVTIDLKIRYYARHRELIDCVEIDIYLLIHFG